MLDHPSEVIRALVRYRDVFDLRGGSVITLTRSSPAPGGDPFRGGFIAGIEERAELVRRLSRLDPRKRRVLCLWYMAALPVTQIARLVRISRMHCYRLQRQALAEMTRRVEQSA